MIHSVIAHIDQQISLAGAEMRRVFHGRGGYFPNFETLVVEWFSPVLMVRLYQSDTPEWFAEFLKQLADLPQVDALVLRHSQSGPLKPELIYGELPDPLIGLEEGLRYKISPLANQNSGVFLDMRMGREWVKRHAERKNVLNLFSYTGGFSMAALQGGADQVINIDMSRGAIRTSQQNHQLNDLKGARFFCHDLFRSWGKLRRFGPYDLIIVDPPSYQFGSFVASSDYPKVLKRISSLIAPEGDLLLCHNDPQQSTDFIREMAKEHLPNFKWVERLDNPPEFEDINPEASLKVMHFKAFEISPAE